MKSHLQFSASIVSAFFAALSLFSSAARASIIPTDSTYTIQGVNAPDNFGPTDLIFNGTAAPVDGGALEATAFQVPDGSGGEWDVFSVSTAQGGSLAGNIDAYWSLGWGFDVATPALWDATAIWWTDDGVAFDPIYAFSGVCCPATNPVNPSWGEAYYNTFTPDPLSGFVTFNPTVYVTPYNFITDGGIDPSTANGFDFAFHLYPANACLSRPASCS